MNNPAASDSNMNNPAASDSNMNKPAASDSNMNKPAASDSNMEKTDGSDGRTDSSGIFASSYSSQAEPTHQELMQQAKAGLAEIIKNDPLLCDLPSEITLEEINSQIALEYGQAMVVNICRADDQTLAVVIPQSAKVIDLKHAIKRHVTLKQKREGGKTHLSWRYIWKRYALYFSGQKLTDDNKTLKEYGIRNKDEVTFVKRLKER